MTKYMTHQSPGIRIICPHHNVCDYEEYYHKTNRKIGGVAWKLDVGKDLNDLLAIAEELQTPDTPFDGDRTNRDLFKAIHGIVDRIAQVVELETEAEDVEARYVEPGGKFAPDAPERKKAYLAVLKRFRFDVSIYNIYADPAAEQEIHRFCVVTQYPGLDRMMAEANVDNDSMEAARQNAFLGFDWPEPLVPIAIIDLDTDQEWKPDLTTIQWRAAIAVDRLAQSEGVEAHYVKPGGAFAPDRKNAYFAVLKRFSHCDEADEADEAALRKYFAGEKEIRRFCVVTEIPGKYGMIADINVDNDSMEAARRHAFESVGGACPELPVVIIDLDTGEEWEPDFTTIQWRKVEEESPKKN